MKLGFKRGQKGFTLVELMVVMAIMAVLAGIVMPAVTGTQGPAESTQLQSDAQAIQSAAASYNNDSVTADWPEDAVATVYSAEETLITAAVGGSLTGYTAVDWDATTKVRLDDGSLLAITFVPDSVPKAAASIGALDNSKHVFVWLLKEGSATDASTRTVEVYRLADDGSAYAKAY